MTGPTMRQNDDTKILLDIISELNIGDEFFWMPDRLVPFEHWVGHIPFIFWLMKVSKPARFVELGTHRGNSYCAMCQAVATLQLGSTGTAVDTWQGDVHMEREDGLYEEVSAYHDPKYSAFSTLLRATFDQARPYFSDGSIDVLHIDGTHTYEAVRHDFETWKSAMSDRGIVLFHDIEVRRDDFGVWKLWEELRAQYPSIGFKHSHGLGVISVGEIQPPEVAALFELAKNPANKARLRTLFSSRGAALVNQLVLSRTKAALEDHIESLKNELHAVQSNLITISSTNEELSKNNSALLSDAQSQANRIELQKKNIESQRKEIEELRQYIAREGDARRNVERALSEITSSTSWILTAPIRKGLSRFPKLARLGRAAVKGTWWTLTGQLPARLRARRAFLNAANGSQELLTTGSRLRIIPHYLDPNPYKKNVPVLRGDLRVAVHLHLHYEDMLDGILDRLKNIPVKFDLFVSVNSNANKSNIHSRCMKALSQVSEIHIQDVPNRGRDIAPMIVQFGAKLAKYDIFGHFHTKKSPHNASLSQWSSQIFDILLGKKDDDTQTVDQIFELLQNRAKVIVPQELTHIIRDPKGWSENFELARKIVERYTDYSIDKNIDVDFPEGSMFWARGNALSEFLTLPLTVNDFPLEPIASDGTIAHALERLILLFADRTEGEIFRLYQTDSIKDYRYYEKQEDFSSDTKSSDVKILSYYLPQFHPTPENDEWHGKGFTEWTKVRATNPLFEGHYQQHIPHSDTGYYLLDSPSVMRLQADQMKKSGVYGQVFYHYWFGGRLILEEPAQMLLANRDIPMPFCFCWANENWTKRWDGNESEILLGQKYSTEDAQAFIRYLIPFFKDERYIKVDGRPVLFVYRPSHIETARDYVAVWRRVCEEEGLQAPYIVAVLTRGATDPREFDMDAGVERVLHDWTSGAVPEMKDELKQYVPMQGSVLSYPKVAEFYGSQTEPKDFTYLRSVVPMWDNTPRYNDAGIMLHGGTPPVFQKWLENSIDFSRKHLSESERFIVVNAWNEWAEGAHLEPDTRHGYAYLNSIGRALTGKEYSCALNDEAEIAPETTVLLSVPDFIIDGLKGDPVLFEKFVWCLKNSTIFRKARVSVSSSRLAEQLTDIVPQNAGSPDFTIEFHSPCVFTSTTLEKMLRTAAKTGAAVIPNFYGDDKPFLNVTENGSVDAGSLYTSPVVVFSHEAKTGGFTNVRMRTDARCFLSNPSIVKPADRPLITTVIRIHNAADFTELRNALYSLFAMMGCNIVPLIAAQDLSDEKKSELDHLLTEFGTSEYFRPQIMHFVSPDGKGDVRSKMLNEALRAVKTRYAGILDYDDLLLPTAYEYLVSRLKATNTAISFGRTFVARYLSGKNVFLDRSKVYEYGYSFEEFVSNNHAPIHSFLLDLSCLNIENTRYFDDHKYMEDYYLMLQLVTKENADWEGLKLNKYIGDYIHAIDREHTLAISGDDKRLTISKSEEFLKCEQRIRELKVEMSYK